jgi:hypothetical protein
MSECVDVSPVRRREEGLCVLFTNLEDVKDGAAVNAGLLVSGAESHRL